MSDIVETHFTSILNRVYSLNDEINLIIDHNYHRIGFRNIVRYSEQMIISLNNDIMSYCNEFIKLNPDDIEICNIMLEKIDKIFNLIIDKLNIH